MSTGTSVPQWRASSIPLILFTPSPKMAATTSSASKHQQEEKDRLRPSHSSKPEHGLPLHSPPQDSISRLRFSPYSNKLLVSSWDSTVRLYDVDKNEMLQSFSHPAYPLDCCFIDDSSGLAGGCDNSLTRYDFITGNAIVLGKHDGYLNCVEFSELTGQIITGSWDKSLRFWDLRAENRDTKGHAGEIMELYPIESMSLVGNMLVVASGITEINVYDLRCLFRPLQKRQSPLVYKTSCVRCYPNELGFAVGSVDGRVALELFEPLNSDKENSYAFRCVPKSKKSGIISMTVIDIQCHPRDSIFATGDIDGFCILWDRKKKQRYYEFPRYSASVVSLAYNKCGTLLAVASSYAYQENEKMDEKTQVFIHEEVG